MLHIQYTTAAGIAISYFIDGVVCMDDINNLAMFYAQHHPKILPDSVFLRVNVYTDFMKMMGGQARILTADEFNQGAQHMVINTGCGPLVLYALPWAWQGPEVLVGTKEDYDEYDIDKIFEKVVMKDFERE